MEARPSTTVPGQRADETLRRVLGGIQGLQPGRLQQVTAILARISARFEAASIEELSGEIGGDRMLVHRVIEAANMPAFNPWSTPVTTVPEAIQVVGLEKIREIAMALSLFAAAEGPGESPELREAASLALHTGLLAQAFAERLDLNLSEPAFVCGALRHFGRLALAAVLVEDVQAARRLAVDGRLTDEACREVFGLTPLELSRNLLASKSLPHLIQQSLRTISPDSIQRGTVAPDPRILVLTELATRCCHELANVPTGAAADELACRLEPLFREYAAVAPGAFTELRPLAQRVEVGLEALARVWGVGTVRSPLGARLIAISRGQNPFDSAVQAAPVAAAVEPDDKRHPPCRWESSRRHALLQRGVNLLEQMVTSGAASRLEAFNTLLDTLFEALELSQVILFLPAHNQSLAAEHGRGSLVDEVRSQPLLNPSLRDIFSIPLRRCEDVVIQDASAPAIQPFIPAWLRGSACGHSLILLPFAGNNSACGGLVCGVGPRGKLQLPPSERQLLKQMRASLATLALGLRRSA